MAEERRRWQWSAWSVEMAKKLDLGHSKFTLGEANYQPMLTKEEKNLEETVKVGGEISAENQYIVHINEKEGEITKDLIHQTLKETKGHPQEFKNSKGSDNCSLLYILQSHQNLLITILKIQFGENRRS